MKPLIFFLTLLITISFSTQELTAQTAKDSIKHEKKFKNTIRLNVTAPIIFGTRNIILGYERIINKNQSFSFNIGQAAFPKLRNPGSDSIVLVNSDKKSGYNISADYRFYLDKLNKYGAPRGVYVGPYISYVHFTGNHDWEINAAPEPPRTVTSSTNFNIFTIGGELGYQFVFWNRLALDLVLIGPGISSYNFTAKLNVDLLTAEEKEHLQERLTQAIENKFPGLNYVFKDQTLSGNGNLSTTSVGFRYIIHIGFRF